MFHLDYMDAGPVSITNSLLHHSCAALIRGNNNYTTGNAFTFNGNTVSPPWRT